jgi:PAS domain S-box-containing protein
VPVYARSQPLTTAAQRWQALRGFVYSPYRMDDLMAGIFDRAEMLVDFQLYDGTVTRAEHLMYDSDPDADSEPLMPSHQALRQIEEFGQTWTLRVHSRADFQQQFASTLDWLLPFLGTGISLSLFGLVAVLLNRRANAQALAELMMVRHQQATQRFHQLFLNMEQGVTIHNHHGHLIEANPAAQRILGLSHQELTDLYANHSGIPSQHEDGREFPVSEQPLSRAIHQQSSSNDIVMGYAHPQSKAWHWISMDVYRHQSADNRTLEIYQVFTDITERKRIERLKNEFVATVSHELRTPLTAISGALGLMHGGALGELPDKMQQMTEIAVSNSKRLAHLINDLLDIEKMSAGQMQFQIAAHTLQPLLSQAVDTHQTYGAKQQVSIDLTMPEIPIQVNVDSQRLMQVLANLLSNAIKFSPPGGKVSVTAQTDAGQVKVQVTDQGDGVPPEFQQRLFERFAQADSSDTRRKGGTGLGLAISRELILAMHGEIGYQANVQQGATFWFSLPMINAG